MHMPLAKAIEAFGVELLQDWAVCDIREVQDEHIELLTLRQVPKEAQSVA